MRVLSELSDLVGLFLSIAVVIPVTAALIVCAYFFTLMDTIGERWKRWMES
jgi:hypothetical protein